MQTNHDQIFNDFSARTPLSNQRKVLKKEGAHRLVYQFDNAETINTQLVVVGLHLRII